MPANYAQIQIRKCVSFPETFKRPSRFALTSRRTLIRTEGDSDNVLDWERVSFADLASPDNKYKVPNSSRAYVVVH